MFGETWYIKRMLYLQSYLLRKIFIIILTSRKEVDKIQNLFNV